MSQPHDPLRDLASEAVKAIPPVTVYALTLNEWLAAVSIAYVLLQGAYLLWKWRGEWKRRQRAEVG